MPDRGMEAAMLAEIDKFNQRTGHLYVAYFDDETVRATDLFIPITFDGNLYAASGHFLSYEGVEESAEFQILQATISLSVADPPKDWMARALTKEFMGKRMVIYRINLDSSWSAVVNPTPVMDGLMDDLHVMEDPDSGNAVLAVSATDYTVNFDARPGRHTNDAEQRLHAPDDGLFKYVDQVNRELRWGGS